MKAGKTSKQLISKKVINNFKMQSSLKDYFSNPTSYLSNQVDNKTILLNKNSSKARFNISLDKAKSNNTSNTLQNKIYRTHLLMSRMISGKNASFYTSKESQQSLFKTIDNSQIEQIFSYFSQKRNANMQSQSHSNLFKGFGKVFEKNKNPSLSVQHQALREHSKAKEMNSVLTEYISKNAKKSKEDLLMRKAGYFRYKQEIKNDVEKDIKKREPSSILKWPSTLRSSKSFTATSQYYINTGTNDNPKWQLVIDKDNHQGERLYLPTMLNNKEKKEINECLDNSYLHQRVSESTINKLRKNVEEPQLNALVVQGKDLLLFEYELTKTMKRKKLIHRCDSLPNKLMPILFDKNIQYLNSVQSKTKA